MSSGPYAYKSAEEAEAAEGSNQIAEALLAMVRAETGDESLSMLPAESFGLDLDDGNEEGTFPFAPPTFSSDTRRREEEAGTDARRNRADALVEQGTEEEEEEEQDYYEEEEDEEEGDFERMGSREETYGSGGEWVLEAILRRRMNRDKEGGAWVYECKWVGYDEPTWETREMMEDAGFIPQLDAFDAERAAGVRRLPTAPLPASFNLPSDTVVEAEEKPDSKGKPKDGGDGPSLRKSVGVDEDEEVDGSSASKESRALARGYYDKLLSIFGSTPQVAVDRLLKCLNGRVYRYACMRNDETAKAFYDRWEDARDTHYPMFVFHGTNPKNYFSIRSKTLLPGGTNGVSILNGAVYGRGVYTSPCIKVPANYSLCGAIILCIGLVPRRSADFPNDVNKVASCNYLVFCDHTLVYPLMLLQIGEGRGAGSVSPNAPPQHMSFETFQSAACGGLMLGDRIGVGSVNGCWHRRGHSGMRERVPHGQRFASHEDEVAAKKEVEKYRQGTKKKGGIRHRDLRGAPREVKEMARKVLRK